MDFPENGQAAVRGRLVHPLGAGQAVAALDLVERVFAAHGGAEEGRRVRALAEEIRAKFHVPALELVAEEDGALVGYAMFSRFPFGGTCADGLLLLSPVAVRTDRQRRHVSRNLIEFGLDRAQAMGFRAVIVEGNPKNYAARGFVPSYRFGITAGASLRLPSPDCLMARELYDDALGSICGAVDYSCYDSLR